MPPSGREARLCVPGHGGNVPGGGLRPDKERVSVPETSAVYDWLNQLPLRFAIEGAPEHYIRDRKLGEELRSPEVSLLASAFSQLEGVRKFLRERQKDLAACGNIVAEGRDMATEVFPDAAVKVFLTADLATRVRRRHEEYRRKGINITLQDLRQEIEDRDRADQQRDLAPLRPAPGDLDSGYFLHGYRGSGDSSHGDH